MKNPSNSMRTIIFRVSILIIFIETICSAEVLAQRKEDVVYLSNGSVLRGVLTSDSVSSTVRILNHAGDIWVFKQDEVDSITREKPFEYKAKLFTRAGFEYSINGELLMRSGNNAIGKAAIPGISLGMGYRFNPYISTGMDLGVEFYDLMEIPVSASVRLRSSGRVLSPFTFLRAGYTFPGEKRPDDWDYSYKSSGGMISSVGAGIEKIINENTSLLFTFSYHYQELNYHLTPLHQWVQERDRTEAYSRFRVGVGFVFK
jgi:hypothetical protein